ncbi:hypothetical protein ACFX16_038597 [Malus domestica]
MGAINTLIVRENLDSNSQGDLEVQERISLLKWSVDEHKCFGYDLKFVTNKSHEGRNSVKVLEALEGYRMNISSQLTE